jgi:hypothetical protein
VFSESLLDHCYFDHWSCDLSNFVSAVAMSFAADLADRSYYERQEFRVVVGLLFVSSDTGFADDCAGSVNNPLVHGSSDTGSAD